MTKQKPGKEVMSASGSKLVNVEEFASPLAVTTVWNKVGVGGFPGSGKSRTSAEIMAGIYQLLKKRKLLKHDKPLLVIDTERSAAFLAAFFESKGVPVRMKHTRSLADVQTAFQLASQGHFFGVHIDSLTHVLREFMETWMRQNRVPQLEMRHYGTLNPLWERQFGRAFVDAETHITFTGRGTYDYEMVENEQTGKKTMERSGVKMQAMKDTPYDPNLVIWMSQQQKPGRGGKVQVWREGFILKDRAGQIDGKTFGTIKNAGPVWKDFEPHFLYMLDRLDSKAVVAGQSESDEVLTQPNEPQDDTYKLKKIVLDQIKTQLESVAPGRTPPERELWAKILLRAFDESSWKKIETYELETLQQGFDQVKQDARFYRDMKEAGKGEPA